jgi:hypothetical protein
VTARDQAAEGLRLTLELALGQVELLEKGDSIDEGLAIAVKIKLRDARDTFLLYRRDG